MLIVYTLSHLGKSCQPDLRFSERTDVAGGTTTLQLDTDVADLDSGDFQDVTSSDVEDDVNLRGRGLQYQYPGEGWWFQPQRRFAPKYVSLIDKV